ncbi:calcium and integrin-binding family member 3 isoform X2 [Aricia agestis]|uniref:calcium and integrin-binding family member 3 isoform X2 n=1 Tax=Aricia agestis TaxID=91739 RepID=UPI001C209C27|nr:calcium and integrin-binding family member 3 isoform X2 [Aricia agestis]
MSTTPARLTSVATRECRRAIALSGHCRVTVWALSRAMGNKIVTFTEQQLEDYQRFRAVCPSLVPQQLSPSDARSLAVPLDKILTLPELKENPFKRRICEVFSHDGEGLTFDDFLDMMSVFSEAAPRDIKAWYAFRIYDLDNDLYIGKEDLLEASRLLTKGELQSPELDQIVASVLEEADMDGDGQLSFMDFEHVVVRAPDFLSTFHIRV